MPNVPIPTRPGRTTIPDHAHPLSRLVFKKLRDTGMTQAEFSWRSGILVQTLKAWRREKIPSLRSIEAALGVWGIRLLPCPPLDSVPDHVRENLEEVGQHFISDDETLAAAIFAATSKLRAPTDGPAPRLNYRELYWRKGIA